MEYMRKYKGWIILITIVLLVFSAYSYMNNLYNEGVVVHENPLGGQYVDNQNYLSSYISGFYEQISVVQAQTDAIDRVLTDAVKGRYDEGGFSTDSALFTAIFEAYPEAGVAELAANWGSIQDYISAGREGYRAVQSKLLDRLQVYEGWLDEGLIRKNFVRILGFPSDNLVARVGDTTYYGRTALDRMWRIILAQEALDAYESGTLDPLQVPDPNE